jgi:hypothetical protein
VKADMTATRVLDWALEPVAPPPAAPLRDAPALARPSVETRTAAAQLLRDGSARMGVGNPPLGDDARTGAGLVLLAAAIGARTRTEARSIAAADTPPRPASDHAWADAVGRHLLIEPTVKALSGASGEPTEDEPFPEILLRSSPLTSVLHRPAENRLGAGTTADEFATAAGLVRRPRGRRLLTRALARWQPDHRVLEWRGTLLHTLCTDHEDVVLETYVQTRTLFGVEWDRELDRAARGLVRIAAPDDLHLETVRFWAPLGHLRSRDPELIRQHPFLEGAKRALDLVERYRLTVRVA